MMFWMWTRFFISNTSTQIHPYTLSRILQKGKMTLCYNKINDILTPIIKFPHKKISNKCYSHKHFKIYMYMIESYD